MMFLYDSQMFLHIKASMHLCRCILFDEVIIWTLLIFDVGSHKHHGRRGTTHGVKDLDGLPVAGEGKHSKRGYGSHEVLQLCFACLLTYIQ